MRKRAEISNKNQLVTLINHVIGFCLLNIVPYYGTHFLVINSSEILWENKNDHI